MHTSCLLYTSILTKALGVGIIQAAVRGQLAKQTEQKIAQDSMERLNKYAAANARSYAVHACTDVYKRQD